MGGFPGAGQVIQVWCTRTAKGRKHVEMVYPDLLVAQPQDQPEIVVYWIRGRWGIESRLHRGEMPERAIKLLNQPASYLN